MRIDNPVLPRSLSISTLISKTFLSLKTRLYSACEFFTLHFNTLNKFFKYKKISMHVVKYFLTIFLFPTAQCIRSAPIPRIVNQLGTLLHGIGDLNKYFIKRKVGSVVCHCAKLYKQICTLG